MPIEENSLFHLSASASESCASSDKRLITGCRPDSTAWALLLLFPCAANADTPLAYFLRAEGPAAKPSMHLGWGVAALSLAVIIMIIVMLAAALGRRRPKSDPRAIGPESGGIRFLTISVGLSTVALLIALAYTLFTLWSVAQPPTTPALTITVTAYDWWWKVEYDDTDAVHRLITANEVHIPTGVPVEIRLQSADVIHSFWVPLLAGKTQAIPGQVNAQWIQADNPGVYRGQCSTFCGTQHAHMAFEVVAESRSEFDAWRAAQIKPAVEPANQTTTEGLKLFMNQCAGCHTVRGTDAAGVFAPDLTHMGSRRLIAAGTLKNTTQNTLDWVQHAQQIKPGAMMPSVTLTNQQADNLSAYLGTLR